MRFLESAQTNHRLDRKRMTWFQEMRRFILAIMRYARRSMEEVVDSMSAICLVYRTFVCCCYFFDHSAEIAV